MPTTRVRPRRRDERREETRLLLLQAAAELFARRGFHGVSLDAVAEEAGFSKGAIYSNFSSKQELLGSLLGLHCEQQLGEVRSMLAKPMPFDERIRQISAAYLSMERSHLLFTELWLQAMRDKSLRPRLAELYAQTVAAVAEMIEREAEKIGSTLAMPADEIAQAVLAVGDGLVMQQLAAPNHGKAKVFASALRALFQAALRLPDGREAAADHPS
jgi:AcrR family transcriptional regulator